MTPVTTLRSKGSGRFVFLCDHASNLVPADLQNLGLPATELKRHIGWDIGAAGVTQVLSEMYDAPAILGGVSRLVIDCNRQLTASDLIPEISDGTVIPGNRGLNESGRRQRIEGWFHPYHQAVETVLDQRAERNVETVVVSIHSMTPRLGDALRPWQIALSSYRDRSLAEPLLASLRLLAGDIVVGDNEPYDLDPAVDYSVPFHAIRRGLAHLQVEFRQDEIEDAAGQLRWATKFAEALNATRACC